MAHIRQELALGAVRGFGGFFGDSQILSHGLPLGHILAHRHVAHWLSGLSLNDAGLGVYPDQTLAGLHSIAHGVLLAAGNRRFAHHLHPINIIGVHNLEPPAPHGGFEGEAGHVLPSLIHVGKLSADIN